MKQYKTKERKKNAKTGKIYADHLVVTSIDYDDSN